MAVKNPVSGFEELVTESDHTIQTDSEFSNFKTVSMDCMPDNSVISSGLIEVAVMDEDTIILNRDLMGKQSEKISPPIFEESSISPSVFTVGCGNVKGIKNNNKGRSKRSGHRDRDKRGESILA